MIAEQGETMRCANRFCIYYRKGRCLAEDISINSAGVCEDCVYVEIDERDLQARRANLLEKMQRQYQRQANYEQFHLAEIQDIVQQIIADQKEEKGPDEETDP